MGAQMIRGNVSFGSLMRLFLASALALCTLALFATGGLLLCSVGGICGGISALLLR